MNNNNYTDTRLAKAMADITADLANQINQITADAAKQIKADMVALEKARKKRNMIIYHRLRAFRWLSSAG